MTLSGQLAIVFAEGDETDSVLYFTSSSTNVASILSLPLDNTLVHYRLMQLSQPLQTLHPGLSFKKLINQLDRLKARMIHLKLAGEYGIGSW